MIYGYARVSSKDQKLDRQLIELENFGIESNNIYCDKQSGKNFDRTNYQLLKSKLQKGDLLVIKSIDRLGRNYDMIIEEWHRITKTLKAHIKVLDMSLLDTTAMDNELLSRFLSDLVLQVLSFVAENERTNIRKRQAEGIAIAKAKGVYKGRVPKKIDDTLFNDNLTQFKSGNITKAQFASNIGVSRPTLDKLLRQVA
jgi:DNA invertase Pin-like site-specific DNA recombinase